MFKGYRCKSRAAVVHLNFRAGSTFPVPVSTVPSSMDRTSRCNKVDAVRLYASYEFTFTKGAEAREIRLNRWRFTLNQIYTNILFTIPSFNVLPMISEAEFKEFEPRLKFKTRLKYGWFHLKLYSMFQDLSWRSIETGFRFETRLKFTKFGHQFLFFIKCDYSKLNMSRVNYYFVKFFISFSLIHYRNSNLALKDPKNINSTR